MNEATQEIAQEAQEAVVEVESGAEQEHGDEPPKGPSWTAEDEAAAREFKWKSEDEWQGEKPPGYIADPKEYLNRIQRHPIYQVMSEKVDGLASQQEETVRRMQSVNDKLRDQEKAAYEAEIERIRAAQRRAAEDGDMEAFDSLSKQRDSLKEPVADAQPTTDPYVTAYMQSDRGAWTKNPVLLAQGRDIIDANPDVRARGAKEQIDYAEKEIRKLYPSYFATPETPPAPPRAAKVEGAGVGGGSRLSAFDKLPDEAKSQFAAEVKRGTFKDTKEDKATYAEYFTNG